MSKIISDNELFFKRKEIRIYSSTDWLYNNHKKFRTIFQQYEVDYIYCEVSLYNLQFERSDWNYQVRLECVKVIGEKEENICILSFDKQASRKEDTIYIREGWGSKNVGSVWKIGEYQWKVYVNNELIGTSFFYIEDITERNFSSLKIRSIKLYEDDFKNSLLGKPKKPYIDFDGSETRYIYCDFTIDYLLNENMIGEFFIKFFLKNTELKGVVSRIITFSKQNRKVTVSAGWGSDIKGSWYVGDYIVKIIFFDSVIAEIPFSVGNKFIEGISSKMKIHRSLFQEKNFNDGTELIEFNARIDLALKELDRIGLSSSSLYFEIEELKWSRLTQKNLKLLLVGKFVSFGMKSISNEIASKMYQIITGDHLSEIIK